ncbi:MAG: DUF1905 domain-containing protein [Chitinophagaceae bacterium]
MKSKGVKYEFSNCIWKYPGPAAWHFISLPEKLTKEIRQHFKHEEKSWGRLKVFAQIGQTEWLTAIWFDSKLNTYLLPIKLAIRKQELIENGKKIKVIVWI